MSIIIPPLFYGIYAIAKYQLPTSRRLMPTMGLSLFAIYGLVKLGLYSSNKDINALNKELYQQYKDDVTRP